MTFGPPTCTMPSFHVYGVKRSFILNSKIVIFRKYLFCHLLYTTTKHIVSDIKTCHRHLSSWPTLPQMIRSLKHVLMIDMNVVILHLLLTRNSIQTTFWRSPMKLAISLLHIVIHGKWHMAIEKQEQNHGWIWNCYWQPVGHSRFPSITAQSHLLVISNMKRCIIPTLKKTIKVWMWVEWCVEKR